MNLKAAIFDMDGTLVDSLMLWDLLWASMTASITGMTGSKRLPQYMWQKGKHF